MALQARHTLPDGVDPNLAGHSGQSLRLEVRRAEERIGPEAELLYRKTRPRCAGATVIVKEGLGQHAQQLQDDPGVLVFVLFAMALAAGIAQEGIEPGLFLL